MTGVVMGGYRAGKKQLLATCILADGSGPIRTYGHRPGDWLPNSDIPPLPASISDIWVHMPAAGWGIGHNVITRAFAHWPVPGNTLTSINGLRATLAA